MIDKDSLIGSVVHDLRSPLNACLMSLSLIELKASEPSEVLKAVEVVRRNLEREAQLIADLGDAMHIVAGSLTLDTARIDLGEVISAAAVTATLAGREVRWQAQRPFIVDGDAERLERTFAAVLDAVSSSMVPGDKVAITAEEDGGVVRLTFRLEAGKERQRGWERSGGSQKPAAMRLAIAGEIVRRHGGRLKISGESATAEFPLAEPGTAERR